MDGDEPLAYLKNMSSPRLIKTHRPLALLPKQVWTKKPKLIYVVRNPKDALVSIYYFVRNFGHFMDATTDDGVREELQFERETDTWFNHVLEFYALRNETWIHYTSFENMKENLHQEIKDVCKFLNKSISEDQVEKMLKHLSFDEMRNNPQVNHLHEIEKFRKLNGTENFEDNKFIRKGEIGSHKQELFPELVTDLDEWVQNSLKPYGISLDDLLLSNKYKSK